MSTLGIIPALAAVAALHAAPARTAAPFPCELPDVVCVAEHQDRGWLGIAFEPADAPEPPADGVRIAAVHPASPAERAGLRPRDVVVRLNGQRFDHTALRALRLQAGDTVRLRIRREAERDRDLAVVAGRRPEQVVTVYRAPGEIAVREGQRTYRVDLDSLRTQFRVHLDTLAIHADSLHRRVHVMLADSLGPQLERLQRDLRDNVQIRALADSLAAQARLMAFTIENELGPRGVAGAELTELNAGLADYFQGARQGLVVLRVAAGTPAARAGLEPGDVITRANGGELRTIRELRRAIADSRNREVALDVVRKGQVQRLRLRWER